jgi:hypothetical protein
MRCIDCAVTKSETALAFPERFFKEAHIAYISFIPSVLDFLIHQNILEPKKLEIVDDDLLPKVLQGK